MLHHDVESFCNKVGTCQRCWADNDGGLWCWGECPKTAEQKQATSDEISEKPKRRRKKEIKMELQQNGAGFRWEKRKCVDCGKEFIAKNPRLVRCPECRPSYNMEQSKKWHEENKETAQSSSVCKKIRTCYYGGSMGAVDICDYLAITGTRRPCPAGDCVMYKRR